MEQYVKKPAAVQVFALNGATDIILRKDIASEKITDEEGNKHSSSSGISTGGTYT